MMTGRDLPILLISVILQATAFPADQECDLSEAQLCMGTSTDLAPRIYFNPLDYDLLLNIKVEFCGHGIENCLDDRPKGCSSRKLAPYRTITQTVGFVCSTDLDAHIGCLGSSDFQHGANHCFTEFKEEIDRLVTNTSLATDAVNKGMCRAHNVAIDCTWDMSSAMCSYSSRDIVRDLIYLSTQANREALECI